MQSIKIKWLSDKHDCDTCGSSWAEGAEVTMPDGNVLTFTPIAHCFDGQSFDQQYIYEAILRELEYDTYHE